MATTKKPADKKPAKGTKPAKPASGTMTLKDIAAQVGKDPKAVRAKIRKARGGAQVGQGGRYTFTANEAKEVLALFK